MTTEDSIPEQTPAEAEAAHTPDAGPASTGPTQNNRFEAEVHAETIDQRVIDQNIESQVFQLFHGRGAVPRFTCGEYGEPVPAQWEEASALSVRTADAEIEALVQHLEERRVLLLSAERGAGKVRLAVYLAWRLRQRGLCRAPTLVAEPLDRRVRLDIRHLAARDREVQDRVVIFRNFFSRADPEVTRLFERTDRAGWQQLAEQLRARGAYLVFTSESGDACAPEKLSAAHAVHRQLAPDSRELLERELARRLEELEGTAPEPFKALDGQRGWLLDTFRYAPQLFDFVDEYLALEIPGLALEEAWRQMRNADGRILQDLDGDFEGWSFAFTLALAQCGTDAAAVAWVDVDRLHRHVRQWLRRDLNLRYPEGRDDDDADAGTDTRLEFGDTRLLNRVHARVEAGALAHTVRFRDGAPPEGMWRAMFDRHRRALLTVLPGLRALAERGDEELRTLRVLAARIIGRIGEMDPERITFPLVDRWVRSPDRARQALVGPLLDGVLSSPAERYRAACLRHLKVLQRPSPPGEQADAQLVAVIAAYSWVGDHDLGGAMRELGAIAREHLDPMIQTTQLIQRLLENGTPGAAREGAALRRGRARLRELAAGIYKARRSIFLGVQYSVASLCGTRGPGPVLTELRKWIGEGDWQTGVLVALMFLLEDGIADQLEESKAGAGGAAPGCNPLVAGLAESEGEILHLSRFLGELYESLKTPFAIAPGLQRHCLESLQTHLLAWVRDALPVPEHAGAMASLFASLARTHGGVLREPLLQLLARPDFHGNDSRMRAFAATLRL